MKKLIAIIALVFIAFGFTGCNSCTQMYKEFESDFSELDRDIIVLHAFTGDTLFTYSGPCYFSEDTGSVTLIYKVNNRSKKADWVGNFIFQAIEK